MLAVIPCLFGGSVTTGFLEMLQCDATVKDSEDGYQWASYREENPSQTKAKNSGTTVRIAARLKTPNLKSWSEN